MLIAGEAGIGKSRLVAELRQRVVAEGFVLLEGHCFEQDTNFPYAPLVDARRAFFANRSAEEIAILLGLLAVELTKLVPELHWVFPTGKLHRP